MWCRKACDISKVMEFCQEKVQNLHVSAFKNSLPRLHKSSLHMKLCWIWQKRGFYPILPWTYSESNSNNHLHTEIVQTKFNMGTLSLDNHLFAANQSLNSVCPGLAESNSWFVCVSAGQWLKFCDDTPVFWFSELWHMGVQVSDSVVWTMLLAVETGSHHSINVKCSAEILVQVHDQTNRHCLFLRATAYML